MATRLSGFTDVLAHNITCHPNGGNKGTPDPTGLQNIYPMDIVS